MLDRLRRGVAGVPRARVQVQVEERPSPARQWLVGLAAPALAAREWLLVFYDRMIDGPQGARQQ